VDPRRRSSLRHVYLDRIGRDAVGGDLQVSLAGWRGGGNLDHRVHDVLPDPAYSEKPRSVQIHPAGDIR